MAVVRWGGVGWGRVGGRGQKDNLDWGSSVPLSRTHLNFPRRALQRRMGFYRPEKWLWSWWCSQGWNSCRGKHFMLVTLDGFCDISRPHFLYWCNGHACSGYLTQLQYDGIILRLLNVIDVEREAGELNLPKALILPLSFSETCCDSPLPTEYSPISSLMTESVVVFSKNDRFGVSLCTHRSLCQKHIFFLLQGAVTHPLAVCDLDLNLTSLSLSLLIYRIRKMQLLGKMKFTRIGEAAWATVCCQWMLIEGDKGHTL